MARIQFISNSKCMCVELLFFPICVRAIMIALHSARDQIVRTRVRESTWYFEIFIDAYD